MSFGAWFFVDIGPDPDRLEFTLHAAEERNGKEHGYYAEQLRLMFDAEFKADRTAGVDDYSGYGSEQFHIVAANPAELQIAFERCARVIDAWAKRYRIHNMKPKV